MRVTSISLLLISLIFSSIWAQDSKVIVNGNSAYLSNELIVKTKHPESLSVKKEKLSSLFSKFGIKEVNQLFSNGVDSALSSVYSIKYYSSADPFYISAKFKNNPEIEWIEPRFAYEVSYIPNDPMFSNQWNLQKIQASLAWDYSQGDTSVIIGIIDTGVDWLHPDLASNIWTNYNEIPGNGVDDDYNGYIDDRIGWDFGGIDGTPDSDPVEDRPEHGTHVAGISSAVSNNSLGISSIGFKSKIMPVKVCQDNYRSTNGRAYIIFGFEGIKYAADNGAKVINCSWGGGGYSRLGQEIIDYALLKGAVVVAAAGNDNSSSEHYPSSYRNVLSVASTDEGDYKSSFSNYGFGVDVSAPGSSILSTWQGANYSYASGTSMASPLAAGLVALVLARYPLLTPIQAAEIVRISASDINQINTGYVDLLGKGRINALNAMTVSNPKSVRNISIEFSDELGNNNGILEPGETIRVKGEFINYLDQTSNLKIFLETTSPYATVTNTLFTAGSIASLGTFNNFSAPYTFSLAQSLPQNLELAFKIYYTDASYSDFQWIKVVANQTFANQSGNDISLTITSKGNLGFNDYPNNNQGLGMKYQSNSNILFEGALIAGTSSQFLVDAARGANANIQSNDFSVVKPFTIKIPGSFSDIQGNAIFEDINSANKVGLTVELDSYTFTSLLYEKLVILRYKFKNQTQSALSNFHAGLFFDWDMVDGSGLDDFTRWSADGKYGYAYHLGGNPSYFVASALISSADYGFWGILNGGGDGGFGIYDGFAKSEKWSAISSGIGKTQAGGGDISFVISGGPFSILQNDSLFVAFAIAVGDSLNELDRVFADARALYPSIPTAVQDYSPSNPPAFFLSPNYPNPFNPATSIDYSLPFKEFVTLKIYDILGREVRSLVNEEQSAGNYSFNVSLADLNSGVYFYTLRAGSYSETRKMLLLK